MFFAYGWGLLETEQNHPSTSTRITPKQRHKKKRTLLHASLVNSESINREFFLRKAVVAEKCCFKVGEFTMGRPSNVYLYIHLHIPKKDKRDKIHKYN